MTVEELIIYGKKYLHSTHVKMLLADLLNVNPLELLNCLDNQVSEDIINEFIKGGMQVDRLTEEQLVPFQELIKDAMKG